MLQYFSVGPIFIFACSSTAQNRAWNMFDDLDATKLVLHKIKYEHNWVFCCDNDFVGLSSSLGQSCYISTLGEDWLRIALNLDEKNVLTEPLVLRYLFPPFHIKFRFWKQFVKALFKDGNCFNICRTFPGLKNENFLRNLKTSY